MAVKKEEKKNTTAPILQYAIGRRKRATARVRMFEGKGEILVNDKPVKELAPTASALKEFMKPLVQAGITEDHYFTAKVVGGGVMGQLEAVQHGISRCIAKVNEDLKKSMRQGGFLTRDPREKERKKVYHVRARKSPQFSKR
jgi:small subunit ribosomal protein S9